MLSKQVEFSVRCSATLMKFEIKLIQIVRATAVTALSFNLVAAADSGFSDANWTSIGVVNGAVRAIVVDGSGNLYVGGEFTVAADTNVNYVAKWNGSSWS